MIRERGNKGINNWEEKQFPLMRTVIAIIKLVNVVQNDYCGGGGKYIHYIKWYKGTTLNILEPKVLERINIKKSSKGMDNIRALEEQNEG